MKFDQPLQIDTSVKIYETSKIDITAEQFKDGYMKAFQETAKTVYTIGKKFSQLDREIEENKEFLRVSEEIEQARADYNKEWESPEKVNLNDENWVAGRDEALANLRSAEFDIIRNSKLNNMSKEKLAKTSNSNYRERGVRNTFQYGDFTRKRNLDLALTNIDSYIGFLETTDLESDREYIMNKINNSRDILRKYGVDMTMTDLGIVNKIDDAMKKSMKEQINLLFATMEPEQATQQANTLVAENSQKFARIVSQLDDVPKDANAYEFMESFYKANKQEMSKYIGERKRLVEIDKQNKFKEKERSIQEAYYKRDTSKYLDYKFGIKNVSTSQLLNNPDILKLVTDIPAEDFTKKGLAFPFITEGINTALNGQIADRKKDPNYSLSEVYQPIYDFASENCGEKIGFSERRKNLIIDYALKNGIVPDVLIKGETNSDYFKVSNIMSIGNQENKDNLNIRKLLGKKTEKFDELSQAFSPIKAVGDLMATNYVLGKAKARNQEKMLMEFPELGFAELMKGIPTEEYTREIKIAKEITINRTPYRYINYNEQIEEKKELPKPKNTKQSDMFGG